MPETYCLHYAPDNASLIIRLALDELDLRFETQLVDRSAHAQRSAQYRALNPAGRIPTLITPDGPISETGAILLWLTQRHGGLGPAANTGEYAAFVNWLFYMSNTMHADMLSLFYVHRYGPEGAWPDIRQAARKRLIRALDVLHDEARPRLAPWLCGPTPSGLDLYLAALLRWLRLYPADQTPWLSLDSYPAFKDMCARLDGRRSVQNLCLAEGMSPQPFSHPRPPTPPEGTAI